MEIKNAVEIYKEVLSGKRGRFPNNFWIYDDTFNYSNAKEVTIYMIENILCWDEKDVKEKLTHKTFKENGLFGMLTSVFNSSVYEALNNAYVGKYNEWELRVTPRNYWNLDTAKKAIIWLIEEKLKWSENDVKEKLTHKTFKENGLYGMLQIVFNSSVYEALNNAYPRKYYEWELSSVPRNYWNIDTAKKATIWLIEEKLKWSENDVKEKLCTKTFIENGFSGMITSVFNNSVYEALNSAYAGKYNEWELGSVPQNYWNIDTAKKATIWLIEEKLKWSKDDVREKLCYNTFKENGLWGMIQVVFNGNIKLAIENAYGK